MQVGTSCSGPPSRSGGWRRGAARAALHHQKGPGAARATLRFLCPAAMRHQRGAGPVPRYRRSRPSPSDAPRAVFSSGRSCSVRSLLGRHSQVLHGVYWADTAMFYTESIGPTQPCFTRSLLGRHSHVLHGVYWADTAMFYTESTGQTQPGFTRNTPRQLQLIKTR